MQRAARDVAFAALCAVTIAAERLGGSGRAGTATSAHAPQLGGGRGAAQVFPTLAATAALFTAVASIYHRLRHAAAAGAGNDTRISKLVIFVLCACAGFLEFLFFVQPAGGVVDGGAVRAAAVQALPAAASVTFFLAMTLIFVHVGAGGGRDGDGAAGGEGPMIQAAEKLLTKMTLGAAAALVILMALAF